MFSSWACREFTDAFMPLYSSSTFFPQLISWHTKQIITQGQPPPNIKNASITESDSADKQAERQTNK